MAKFKVVVTDHVFPSREVEARLLVEGLGADVVFCPNAEETTLAQAVRDADAVLVTYARISGRVIDAMQKARIIARYGVGVDNIDLEAAARRGLWVTNVPDYCVEEVSDHALALILALARKVVFLDRRVRQGQWDYRDLTPIPRLAGKTLGLVGFGRIARATGRKARAFGMRILAYDPYVKEVAEEEAQLVGLPELLAASDFVSIHVPLLAETRHFIGANELAMMKPTACIVNTSRGGIIDEAALAEALREGRLAGAALDVVEQEPIPLDHPLIGQPNCILTPHVAFYSEESTIELQEKACRQVVKALTGQRPDYVIVGPK